MKKAHIIIIAASTLVLAGTAYVLIHTKTSPEPAPLPLPEKVAETPEPSKPLPVIEKPKPVGPYTLVKLETTTPQKELTSLVGSSNVAAVLVLNRIDSRMLKQGTTLVIPSDFSNHDAFSSFPATISEAASIPKLFLVSQRVQAFAAYEYGTLVRTSGVSTGKKATPTPSRLYFTNWKGKEIKSSFDDEWVLKWNFNLDNFEGIGMHQYEMPGYPASHSCIRMFEEDAKWIYDWADQWILSPDEQTILAHGTPVIVFGDYGFGKTAPWKQLPENPDALKISQKELSEMLSENMETIMKRVQERQAYSQPN
jgi:lipoprotein-anchoring transpeptidase ErfK/SrfK